jgi:hypothetical protein
LWGAPRIHGELLKLAFEIAESTVSKYMIRRRGPPSQTWRTFLRNHADAIAAIDLCVVPTLTFECLFAFLVLGHGRRQLLWFGVTRHPTAEWLAQQIVEAFPWGTAPTYLVRDNDGAYGQAFTNRVRTMGIRDHPISPRSPWQNPYVSSHQSCPDCITTTGGYDFREGQAHVCLMYSVRTSCVSGPLRKLCLARNSRNDVSCQEGDRPRRHHSTFTAHVALRHYPRLDITRHLRSARSNRVQCSPSAHRPPLAPVP